MSEQELDIWENENSFISYRSVLNEAYQQLDSIDTEDEKATFIDKYGDVLSLQGDQWVPRIEIPLYQSIVNRKGIYETNGYLNKVVGDYIITAKNSDYEKLLSVVSLPDSVNKIYFESEGIKIFRFTGMDSPQQTRSVNPCYQDMTASYFYNRSNCKDDREVYINAKSYISLYSQNEGDYRQPRVKITVWGEERRGTWCNWRKYYTTLAYRNVRFTISAWKIENGVPRVKTYDKFLPDYSPSNDRYNLTWDQPIGDKVLNQAIAANPFIYFHGEASSRGTNNNWAVLECQIIY